MTMFGRTVTLVSRVASGQDADGNDAFTETPKTYGNVPIVPRDGNATSANENTQGRETVIVGVSALFPPGTKVGATDRVLIAGVAYEVEGQPGEIVSPFTGWNPGVVVPLKRVTG